jgi:hypothetical protein
MNLSKLSFLMILVMEGLVFLQPFFYGAFFMDPFFMDLVARKSATSFSFIPACPFTLMNLRSGKA